MNPGNTLRPSKQSADSDLPSAATDMEERWRLMTSPNSNTIEPADKSQRQYLEMVARGFNPVEQDYIASDNAKPAGIYYKEEDGKTRYEIPGLSAIGGGAGYAEFQGKRKGGGSFSVMPGLSQAEKKRVAEIQAREKNQRERDELASFMNQFTQPPGDMNPMQAGLWQLQQQQLGNFVKMQTEQQSAIRQAQIKADQERAQAQQEQANWNLNYNAGREDARAKLYQDAQGQRSQAAYQNAQMLNDQQKNAQNAVKQFITPDLTQGGASRFDYQGFSKVVNAQELPADRMQIIPGNIYQDPTTGGFATATEDGVPVVLMPDEAWLLSRGYIPPRLMGIF